MSSGPVAVLVGRDREKLAAATSPLPVAHAVAGDATAVDTAERAIEEAVQQFGALGRRARDLDQRQLAFDHDLTRVISRVQDVDQLVELLDNLLKRTAVP